VLRAKKGFNDCFKFQEKDLQHNLRLSQTWNCELNAFSKISQPVHCKEFKTIFDYAWYNVYWSKWRCVWALAIRICVSMRGMKTHVNQALQTTTFVWSIFSTIKNKKVFEAGYIKMGHLIDALW